LGTGGEKRLQPVYGISLEERLHEREMHRLTGYRGKAPVILGNKDSESVQHDVYGDAVLALTQTFFDKRLDNQGTEILFKQLEELGQKATEVYNKPDTGTENRKQMPQIHTNSSAMCWAACDRLAKIAERLQLNQRAAYWRDFAKTIRTTTLEKAWNEDLKSFTSSWEGNEVDAFLLLLPRIGFIDPREEKYLSTLDLIEKNLRKGNYLQAFPSDTVCNNSATFYYIYVLAEVGRLEEARSLFEVMLKTGNHVGLLSDTVDPNSKELWGNFPQSVAMVGLIDCAIRLSKPWKGAF